MSNKYKVALEVLKKLNDNNFDAYIVGGYPRDLYLGIKSDDIDICTSAKLSDIRKIFTDVNDNKYNSYVLSYKNFLFQITTFRKDRHYLNSRFPSKVCYTNKLKTDLKRRDFVINTLCIDSTGSFVDLIGAREAIDMRVVSLVGNGRKIHEDSLRILRAIRFACVLDFSIDSRLSRAINKYKGNLNSLSFDRKKAELEKIFTSNNASYGIRLLHDYGLDTYLHVDLSDVAIVDILGIWAQVIVDNSYNFTKEERFKILAIKELINNPFEIYDLYKYGPDVFSIVSDIKNDDLDIKSLYDSLPIKDRADIDVNFFEICDVVPATNQTIKVIYDDLERKIIYKELSNKKKDILKYIKKNYK